ncbi:MAG: sugar ABC transporter permease [Oscillospiraceae bacterium]|nr:sugar ABC transporter permease [Oscillospiraceae bacterium]
MSETRAKSRKIVSYAKYGYIFIAPFFIVYCFFMVYPLINTFILSFQGNDNLVGVGVGFDNYKALLFGMGSDTIPADNAMAASKDYWSSWGITLILWAGNFVVQLALSLLLAVWFSDTRIKLKGAGFFKVVFYLPNIITAVSVAGMFIMLFGDTKYNVVNSVLLKMGLVGDPIKFVTNDWIARVVVMFIQSWMWFGNTTLLLMSGIFGIDPSIYEAASIDGSSGMHQFINITMPILKPIFLYVFITSMIGGLQMFDIPYMYNNTGTTSPFLRTQAVYIYNHFYKGANNYGYSAAASIILFIITAALGLVIYNINTGDGSGKKRKGSK